MTITKFRETHKADAVLLSLSKIHLFENCHRKAEKKGHRISELHTEPMCVVHGDGNGEYNLIIGYRDYMKAKKNDTDEVKAIIVPDESRKDFLKSLLHTFEMWDTSAVHEPKDWTYPNPEKVRACQKLYENTGTFGKKIIISPNGTILDGYTAVCAARLLGVKRIPVYIYTMYNWKKIHKKKISKTS